MTSRCVGVAEIECAVLLSWRACRVLDLAGPTKAHLDDVTRACGKLIDVRARGYFIDVRAGGKLIDVRAGGKLIGVRERGNFIDVRARRIFIDVRASGIFIDVIPAKAGIHWGCSHANMGFRLRANGGKRETNPPPKPAHS